MKEIRIPIIFIPLVITIGILVFMISSSITKNIDNQSIMPELKRTFSYTDVQNGDEEVLDSEGNTIAEIEFDAFFKKDTDGDGIEEALRGTCNEIGTESNLYINLKTLDGVTLKNGTIAINSNNFYFNTSILKDNEIANNYISANTKEIQLNEIANSTEKIIVGSLRSGDYSSSATITQAIGNDTSKYSMENSIIFSGIYIDSNGNEKTFTKTVSFIVDWYGKVNVDISPKNQTITVSKFEDLKTDKELKLDFSIITTETLNQLNMYGAYISGTIPELNGYKPTSVKFYGVNVKYTYNDETCEFTAKREATKDDNGIIISNAYTSTTQATKNNSFNVTLTYPLEAYQEMGSDVSSFEISIPIIAVNKGYNNPHEEDGFENPFTSDSAQATVVTTWRKEAENSSEPSFNINVGTYMATPYDNYVISKKKPLNIYNGKSSEEDNDTYIVQWKTYTGDEGITDGIILKETVGKTDKFLNTESTYISMEDITTNIGIYFTGATQTLGQDGWIKVYDDKTNILLETFTSSNWNSYSASKPYYYANETEHIRIETSKTNATSYFYVNNVKEIDDEYITTNFNIDEFCKLSSIYSYLSGYMIQKDEGTGENSYWYQDSKSSKALYESPTSIATIGLAENEITTHSTIENQKITIETSASGYNRQGWKNGTFLIQLPSKIISAKVNNITINNNNVKISAYDVYEEDGNYYIKILTKNEDEEEYKITIDCNLTPDPRIKELEEDVKLYAINENAYSYYYSTSDIYDIDGDLNKTEEVNYKTTLITYNLESTLATTQILSNYTETNTTTIAPGIGIIDKSQNTAKISITARNNYVEDIRNIKILGLLPFEGNGLESEYTTYMNEQGVQVVTSSIQNLVKVYYSTQINPDNDLNNKINGWRLAENIADWNLVKAYLIVFDETYRLASEGTIQFEYDIKIPENIEYNKTAYSQHVVSFKTESEETDIESSSEKLGLRIAKQYDLNIIKYQKDTDKTLPLTSFSLKEKGENTSIIKTTDENGLISISGLYVEKNYILKEQKTTGDYVLNEQEIHFYVYDKADGEIGIAHKNTDGTYSDLKDEYTFIKNATITNNTIKLEIENEVNAKLAIYKKDKETGEAIKDAKFTLTGQGKNEEILTTDEDGYINVDGLYLENEYILKEIKSTGYYISESSIKFTITQNSGTFEVSYSDNGITENYELTTQDEIPILNLQLVNEKIVTYGFQLTKYASGESTVLEGAKYKIFGDGIKDTGKVYTTDENGIITIDGLYEYVSGKSITGEYTISEIYAPAGYAVNSTKLRFRAYREDGTLKMQILEGESVIRMLRDENTETDYIDLNIENSNEEYPVIQIGVEDVKAFTIFKYYKDGITQEKVPIPGTKFIITDLKGNYVTGTDGKAVGEWVDTTPELLDVPQLTLTSTSTYAWTQNEDGTWVSSGNYNINSSTSTLTSNNFELLQPATLVFDWTVSSQSASSDYVYYTITDLTTGNILEGTGTSTKIGGTTYGVEYETLEYTNIAIDLPKGTYQIEFVYRKNNNTHVGLDAGFVKNIRLEQKELEKTGYYEVTTDENGLITANLPVGLYKAVETYTDDKYILEENEEDRTYYFGVGITQAETYDWTNSISGNGWNYINSVDDINAGGVIGVGSISEYSSNIVSNGVNGIDIDKDGIIDEVSQGSDDGIIVTYDSDGKYVWSEIFGGSDDDSLSKVIQTSDGGFAIVGYVSSSTIKLGTQEITELAKSNYGDTLANKDAILLKISSTGNYEWAIRMGGISNDEINAVVETSEKNIVIVGSYYSDTFNFYNSGSSYEIQHSFANKGKKNAFIASYSETGKYQWSQRIGGDYDLEAVDIVEHSSGLTVAVNSIGGVETTTNATTTAYSGGVTYQIAGVLGYGLDGSYIWNATFGGSDSANDEVSSIDVNKNGNIIVGVNYGTSKTKSDIRIYETSVSGSTTTSTLIYTLSGTIDDHISDLEATADGGILFGGWYYSSEGLDVDGDGNKTGEKDLSANAGEYSSDAYLIKIDNSGTITFSSRLYGDSYDVITSVAETENGSFVIGGYFNSSTVTVTNCNIGNNQYTDIMTGGGNFDGFVATLQSAGEAIEATERLEVENKMKSLKITTQVIQYAGVYGGNIDGDFDITYDDFTYTEDGVRYIETVDYGGDSTRDITITPDEGYIINYIKINNEEHKNYIVNSDGTVVIPAFAGVTENIHIAVEFSDQKASVEVNHYLWTEEDGLTTTKVAETEYYTGEIGTTYEVLPKKDIDYELITIAEYTGNSTNYTDVYIPDNYAGTYIEGTKDVVNYYYKEKKYTIIVHHYLEGTNEAVPLKGSTTGENVPDEKQENLVKGTEYTTTQASEDMIDYIIYELVEIPADSTGVIQENLEITYYYRLKTVNLNITKVAEEDNKITIPDTEFALYKLISETTNNNLIDKDNVDENWELVKTYKSSNTGSINLEDLPISSEYRLVEITPAEGRMLPDGQWKIEFIYQDYDQSDASIIEVNGTKLRITAVGNPPALIMSDEGKLLLPNKKIFDLPTSGNIGTTIFYQFGILIITSGILLLVIRKTIIKRHQRWR